MSANKGIYKVKKEALNQLAKGKTDTIHSTGYGLEKGMKEVEFNGGYQPADWKRSDGTLFPHHQGSVKINSGKEEIDNLPPPVYVEQAKRNINMRQHNR